MATQLRKAEVLLEEEQYDALVEIAKEEGRTVPEILREMLQKPLRAKMLVMGIPREKAEDASERGVDVMERIREHREAILASRGGKPLEFDVVEEINKMRDERDEELMRDWNINGSN